MTVPPHHFDDEPNDVPTGGLLGELERRQDDVLSQLDDLDAKLKEVLQGLETGALTGAVPTEADGPGSPGEAGIAIAGFQGIEQAASDVETPAASEVTDGSPAASAPRAPSPLDDTAALEDVEAPDDVDDWPESAEDWA